MTNFENDPFLRQAAEELTTYITVPGTTLPKEIFLRFAEIGAPTIRRWAANAVSDLKLDTKESLRDQRVQRLRQITGLADHIDRSQNPTGVPHEADSPGIGNSPLAGTIENGGIGRNVRPSKPGHRSGEYS